MSAPIILFGPLPPPYGGVTVYLQTLNEHLRSENIRVWAYKGEPYKSDRIRFINQRRLETLWALISEGKDARILDATHFHLEYPNPLLLTIWLLLKPILRFQWYKNVHDGSLPGRYQNFSTWRRFWFHRALKTIDEFVVVSEELKHWLQESLRVPQAITVIPGLLPPLPAEAELDPEIENALANYLRANKRVCCIGVFIFEYGFAAVADGVDTLRNQTGENIHLLLLDGEFARDDSFRADVLSDRAWITVLERVPNEKIPAIQHKSDVFVRAFRDESFGISRIEAIWSGTPVIATTAGETRGMRTYEFGDQEKLVEHLRSVLFESSSGDTSAWAARYREEAENNLRALREVLQVDGPH